MADWNLDGFLSSLAGATLGHIQGQEAARQQIEQQKQINLSRDLQQFQMLQQAEDRERQDRMAGLNLLGENMKYASPEGQRTILQAQYNMARNQPARTYGSAAARNVFAGLGLPAAPTAQPTAVTTVSAPEIGPTAAGERPALSTEYGQIPLGGGVSKDRLTRIQQNFTRAQKVYQDLPTTDPNRKSIQDLVDSLNMNPQTEGEADETDRRLNQILFNYGGAGRGQQTVTAQALRDWEKAAPEEWARIRQADEATLPDMLLAFAAQADEMKGAAKGIGRPLALPAAFRGESGEISRLQGAMAEADATGDYEEARGIARQIAARIKSGMTIAQETARGRLASDQVNRLNPADPSFETKARGIFKSHGVPHLYPEGGGLSGSARERYKQQLIGKLPSLKGIDPKQQQVLLGELRRYIKLTGGDPSQVPADIQAQLDPNQQADLTRKLNEQKLFDERAQRDRDKEQREKEAHQAAMDRARAGGKVGLNQAQTLAVLRGRLSDARKAEQTARGSWGPDVISVDEKGKAQIVSYMQGASAKLGLDKTAQALEKAAARRIQAEREYNDYFKQVKAPPTRTAPTAAAAPRKPGAATTKAARPRSYYFQQLQRLRPGVSAAQINAVLDARGIR